MRNEVKLFWLKSYSVIQDVRLLLGKVYAVGDFLQHSDGNGAVLVCRAEPGDHALSMLVYVTHAPALGGPFIEVLLVDAY